MSLDASEASVAAELRLFAWATLENPAMTMEQGRAELEGAGNVILEEDPVGRRFKLLDQSTPLTESEAMAFGLGPKL